MVRPAFTLIELIIAIVVLGIVFISIPFILLNNARSLEQNLLQEAVLLTTTKMGQILSYPWDENSSVAATLAKTEVVEVSVTDAALLRSTEDFRVGHFQEALHRKMTPNALQRAASNIKSDANDLDDIDDFDSNASTVAGTAGAVGYKSDYSLQPSVRYVSDSLNAPSTYGSTSIDMTFTNETTEAGTTTAATSTNIKRIVVTTSKDGNPVITLHAYSSNIGETDYYKRRY